MACGISDVATSWSSCHPRVTGSVYNELGKLLSRHYSAANNTCLHANDWGISAKPPEIYGARFQESLCLYFGVPRKVCRAVLLCCVGNGVWCAVPSCCVNVLCCRAVLSCCVGGMVCYGASTLPQYAGVCCGIVCYGVMALFDTTVCCAGCVLLVCAAVCWCVLVCAVSQHCCMAASCRRSSMWRAAVQTFSILPPQTVPPMYHSSRQECSDKTDSGGPIRDLPAGSRRMRIPVLLDLFGTV